MDSTSIKSKTFIPNGFVRGRSLKDGLLRLSGGDRTALQMPVSPVHTKPSWKRGTDLRSCLALRPQFEAIGVWKNDTAGSQGSQALCDFDFSFSPRLSRVWATLRIVGIKPKYVRLDRSRRGWHLVVALNFRLRPAELTCLQLLFGSDRRRETLNLMRVIAIRRGKLGKFWQDRWNLLFERKL